MKSAAERKQDERDRLRAAGFVLLQLWVHKGDYDSVKRYHMTRLSKRARRELKKRKP
jgi:hypothetical protein